MSAQPEPWLPLDFVHPERVELSTGDHLRPIREADVEIDYPAVMGSRDRLWSIFGEPWGWPPTTMTMDQDRADLARHEREIRDHQSFNYAVLDAAEARLLGCVYIDPPERTGADADISWWVVDEALGGPLDATLLEFVPKWIADQWPFRAPRFIGRDLSWAQWHALPEVPPPSDAEAVLRRMVEMFASGDVSDVGEVVAGEYDDHQGLRGIAIRGPDGFQQVVAAARSGIEGLRVTVEDLIADGDRAAARLRWRGVLPSGERVDRQTIDIIRTHAGKAVEHWGASE